MGEITTKCDAGQVCVYECVREGEGRGATVCFVHTYICMTTHTYEMKWNERLAQITYSIQQVCEMLTFRLIFRLFYGSTYKG